MLQKLQWPGQSKMVSDMIAICTIISWSMVYLRVTVLRAISITFEKWPVLSPIIIR